ncbi:putative signal transduction protein with CBS domains [Candidatus Nitrososphaera gargensis Ga9.2]|uniref:Putative signal transduction protein with CBS domains n=1 Tax=Nitrososphaera gargensis (strain Ga9.2) TaxID=1237085 RepID=K0IC72_NITGG|nr:CBS domain-containing protein [Candidatus Nitrososphaera gargensis]AFU58956.1 putative signal transduction protein with CBS domains [Candidatus Nitrososphaera gargensis Ga9.2]
MKQQAEERQLKVGDFMSSPVVTVRPNTNFVDAVQVMILKGIGNLVVVEGERVDGIITERELLQHLVLNKTVTNKQVRYVLTQKFTKINRETSILEAAKTMISKKARLLVFEKERRTGADQLVGIITASDIVRAFLQTDRNPSIESAMTNRIFTIKPDNTILAAAKMMLKKGIGSVVVTTNGSPYAIFTERDLLRVLGQRIDIEERVGAYCTYPVVTAKLGIGAKDAAKIMFSRKIKRLPLTKGDEIVAMVTARDLVEAFQRGR